MSKHKTNKQKQRIAESYFKLIGEDASFADAKELLAKMNGVTVRSVENYIKQFPQENIETPEPKRANGNIFDFDYNAIKADTISSKSLGLSEVVEVLKTSNAIPQGTNAVIIKENEQVVGFHDFRPNLSESLAEKHDFCKTPDSAKAETEVLTSEDFEVKSNKPKILIADLETAPNTSYIWRHYEQNALKHLREWYMLGFCAKWLDTGEVVSRILPDYPNYVPDTDNDKAMVTELWELYNQADVIIWHNGDQFDAKKSNSRFIINGLRPPAPYKTIDTKKVARRYFGFNSNKLDDLGKTLGVGRKVTHTGFALWDDCINGDMEAWEMMRMYNRQDVLLLEKVYNKLKIWMVNHPNMAILSHVEDSCPVCASSNLIQQGYSITTTGKKRRYNCLDCGAWAVGKHKKMVDIR